MAMKPGAGDAVVERSLLWHIGLPVLIAQLVVTVAGGVYGYRALRASWYEDMEARGRAIATALEWECRLMFQMVDSTRPAAGPVMKELAEQLGVQLTLMDAGGWVVGDSLPGGSDEGGEGAGENGGESGGGERYKPEVQGAFDRGEGIRERRHEEAREVFLFVARRVEWDGEVLGVIRVGLPVEELHGRLRTALLTICGIGAALLGVSFVVLQVVSRSVGGTIVQMARVAGRFARGDLEHRVSEPAGRELAGLSRALNRMAEELDRQFAQLKRGQNEQQAILQSMSNAVIALDLEQRVLIVNRAAEQMLHLKSEQVRGRLLQEALRQPELNRFVGEAIAMRARTSGEFNMEGEAHGRIEATSEPLRDADDKQVGLVIVLDDVTQKRQFEALRSDFAANVSHELRTPITAIKGYLDTLLEVGLDDRAQAEQFLGVVKRNTERLAAIIEDLLSLAWLERPGARTTLETVNLSVSRVVSRVVDLLGYLAEAKRITIRTQVPEELQVRVNGPLFEQALANLVGNAIKYSGVGTTVTIAARTVTDGHIEIEVRDEGPGIDPEHLPRIWERFYRVDKARSRDVGGTGLGLAIVKHIAMIHGGKVDVESRSGQGSRFRLLLPSGSV